MLTGAPVAKASPDAGIGDEYLAGVETDPDL